MNRTIPKDGMKRWGLALLTFLLGLIVQTGAWAQVTYISGTGNFDNGSSTHCTITGGPACNTNSDGTTAVIAKPAPARTKVATAPLLPPHAPLQIAQTDQPVSAAPAADAAPESKSLLTRTIEIKDHVVGATLHAVSAIGSIPSWIASMGDRVGGSGATSSSAGRMFPTSL